MVSASCLAMRPVRQLNLIFVVISLFLSGCGKDFTVAGGSAKASEEPASPAVAAEEDAGEHFFKVQTTTNENHRLKLLVGSQEVETSYRQVGGKLDIRGLTPSFDKIRKKLTLKGEIAFSSGAEQLKFPFVMTGIMKKFSVQLVPEGNENHLQDRFKAIATCSDDQCRDYYVDFYYLNPIDKVLYTDKFVSKGPSTAEIAPPASQRPQDVSVVETTPPAPGKKESPTANPPPAKEDERKGPPKNDDKKILTPIKPVEPPQAGSEGDDEILEDGAAEEDENSSITPVAYSNPKIEEIMSLFPQLKEERKRVEQKLKENLPATGPESTGKVPVLPKVGAGVGPGILLKPLGAHHKEFPEKILKVLKNIPTDLPQANETRDRKGRVKSRRLDHPVSLLPFVESLGSEAGLHIRYPEQRNYFGTSELVSVVLRIGQWIKENVGNISLDVGDLSDKNGGVQFNSRGKRSHLTHQHGIDVDLGYVFVNNNPGPRMRIANPKSEEFLLAKQWELFKTLFSENSAHSIYVSPEVKKALCQHVKQTQEISDPATGAFAKSVLERLKPIRGHHNHFHLRVKCGPDQKFCQDTARDPILDPCPR